MKKFKSRSSLSHWIVVRMPTAKLNVGVELQVSLPDIKKAVKTGMFYVLGYSIPISHVDVYRFHKEVKYTQESFDFSTIKGR